MERKRRSVREKTNKVGHKARWEFAKREDHLCRYQCMCGVQDPPSKPSHNLLPFPALHVN